MRVALVTRKVICYDFSTLYDDMAGSVGAITTVDDSHFTATNSARGLIFSITVSGDISPGNPLTGTVSAIDIYDLTGHMLVTSNGWNFLASDLTSAILAYAGVGHPTTLLDAIFGTVSYSAVGNFVSNYDFNNSSVNFGGDTFISGTGDDVFNGLTNTHGDYSYGDTVDYSHAPPGGGNVGVTVNLAISGPQDTIQAGTDTLINIENMRGSAGNDTLLGDDNLTGNVLEGGPGDDTLDGSGGGPDTASYEHAATGATVSLALQGVSQNTGGAGNDTLFNFENLRGSNHNDSLTGDGNDNVLEGGPGADNLDGGGGNNTASYEHAASGVTANLSNSASNLGEAAGDTYTNIENLFGSRFNDILIGDNNNNRLNGNGTHNGSDILTGNGGSDTFVVSGGNVTVTDFSHDGGDLIDLSSLNNGAGITDVALLALIAAAPDTHTLNFGNGTVLILQGVDVHSLTSSDFILHL